MSQESTGKYSKKISAKVALDQLRRMRAYRESIEDREQSSSDDVREGYLKAAAVLYCFDPEKIKPLGKKSVGSLELVYAHLLPACEIMRDSNSMPMWRLRSRERHLGLKLLGTAGAMRNALQANPDRPQNDTQKAIEALLDDANGIDYGALTFDELSAFVTASNWLRPHIDTIVSEEFLTGQIASKKLFAPFRKLLEEGFVGRQDSLRRLRTYVGLLGAESVLEGILGPGADLYYSLVERPPFYIHGPGGVGKSTLLAKFIVDHANYKVNAVDDTGDDELSEINQMLGNEFLPFVYLDLDRVAYSPERPLTFLIGAYRQLSAQFPSVQCQEISDRNIQEINRYLGSSDSVEYSKNIDDRGFLVREFAEFASSFMPQDIPLIFVLDTFEEAQFLGQEIVFGIWRFLDELQAALPRLRLIIAGRALPKEFNSVDEPLEDLGPEIATLYLKRIFKKLGIEDVGDDSIAAIIKTAGTNPLSLRMAAQLFQSEGVDWFREIKTRNMIGMRLGNEIVQGRLYGRVLQHLHDPKLRKLAHPGLVLRRITPEIIRDVLAKPCGLKLKEGEEQELFEQLSKEIALVEKDDEDPLVLRHRTDVRRNMLTDIETEEGETAAKIDRAAVAYYRDKEGVQARAEEIYHRLRLDQKPETVDQRWIEGVGAFLSGSVEELPSVAKLYLAGRLGITLDTDSISDTDIAPWEKMTEKRVRRLLAIGEPDEALRIMSERQERTALSPLYTLEIEALRMMARYGEAHDVIERAIASAGEANSSRTVAEMLRHKTLILEIENNLKDALESASEAVSLLERTRDHIPYLRVAVTELRLLRKLNREEERAKLASKVLRRLTPELKREMRRHPALLRETSAELGEADEQLVVEAINKVGIQANTVSEQQDLAKTLTHWDANTEQSAARGTLGEIARLDAEALQNSSEEQRQAVWKDWITTKSESELTNFVKQSIRRFGMNAENRESLVENLRNSVETIISGKMGEGK